MENNYTSIKIIYHTQKFLLPLKKKSKNKIIFITRFENDTVLFLTKYIHFFI